MRAARKEVLTHAQMVARGREIEARKPMPKAAVTAKVVKVTAKKLDDKELRAERRRKREAIQKTFWNNRHWAIRVKLSRATIGEIFNIARSEECLLTLRLQDPIILPLDVVKEIAEAPRTTRSSSDEVFQVLKNASKDYHRGAGKWDGKARKAVKHPKWKEPKERPKL